MRRLRPIPTPQRDPENWPVRGVLSFIMNASDFAPVCDKGDKVYVATSRRVRAKGGDYIMATEAKGATRHVIVYLAGPGDGPAWDAVVYGCERGPGNTLHYSKSTVRLSREKWRPVYRVVGVRYDPAPRHTAELVSDHSDGP